MYPHSNLTSHLENGHQFLISCLPFEIWSGEQKFRVLNDVNSKIEPLNVSCMTLF